MPTSVTVPLEKNCEHCYRMASSQLEHRPSQRSRSSIPSRLCSRTSSYTGVHHPVIVDKYSNWQIIAQSTGDATGLIKHLRRTLRLTGCQKSSRRTVALSSPLKRPGLSCIDGAYYTTAYHIWCTLTVPGMQRLE